MKKICRYILLMIMATLLVTSYSCLLPDKFEKMCRENISEIRINEFEYSDEEIYISYSGGYREEPYRNDGIKTEMIEYGVVKLVFFDYGNNFQLKYFCLTINNDDYVISLEQNPFDNSLMGDIRVCADSESNIFAMVRYSDKEKDVRLNEFTHNFRVDSVGAFRIFIDINREIIDESIIFDELHGEFKISILENILFSKTIKYWYISFYTGTKSYAICIDPFDAKNIVKY